MSWWVFVLKGEMLYVSFTSHGHPHSAPSIHDIAVAATYQMFPKCISALFQCKLWMGKRETMDVSEQSSEDTIWAWEK